jgi:integrase
MSANHQTIKLARKIILNRFEVTKLAEEGESGAVKIIIPASSLTNGGRYFLRPKMIPEVDFQADGKQDRMPSRATKHPLILDSDGVPWPEGNLWLLSEREANQSLETSTYLGWGDDLTAFLQWVNEYSIDWLNFPSQKQFRPTYRYRGYLRTLISGGKIAASTAKRRMSVVIRFYRWLKEEELYIPQHAPWDERDVRVASNDLYGKKITKIVTTTDLSIRETKQIDPYSEFIIDNGKLRPLSQQEQEWLLGALTALGNTEMTLIHLFGLVTGARIQTILTFRVQNFLEDPKNIPKEWCCQVGPGTFIDTKNDKKLVLHIPQWFYEMVHTYVNSERAKQRRLHASGGDTENQYLFLSIRGNPLYESKFEKANGKPSDLKYDRVGKGVRQYITDYIIPYIRKNYNDTFHYKFHDTRATFGMNLVDDRMKLLADGRTNLIEVLDYVRVRMSHSQLSITERYLNYRSRLRLASAVQDDWETHLENLSRQAMV